MISSAHSKMSQTSNQLRRELSAGQMAMIAVGGSIGTGLLLGSGAAIQVAGPAAIVSYLVRALLAFAASMPLGALASWHPAGGAFGPLLVLDFVLFNYLGT